MSALRHGATVADWKHLLEELLNRIADGDLRTFGQVYSHDW